MPITINRPAPDVFVMNWVGRVTMLEINHSHDEALRMATEDSITDYVHIINAAAMGSFPMDPAGFLRVLYKHPQNYAVLIVNAPLIGRSVARILSATNRTLIIEVRESLDDAIHHAKDLNDTRRKSKPNTLL